MTKPITLDLSGRVALVTGGGQGIGAGIVEALAACGAVLGVNDLSEESAAAVVAKVVAAGGEAVTVPGDVSSVEDVERVMTSVKEAFGSVDILVNNAAITRLRKLFVDHTVEEWDRMFSVNVRGVFLCCQAVLPAMIERRSGNIINIASISVFHTTTEHVAYAASKAAIVTMTRDIASEVAEFGVRVNAVAPGPIDSRDEFTGPFAGVLVNRAGKPADIANAVAFLVSDAASFIVGETLPVAGGSDLKVDR